jgi:hypothetical protein
MMANGGDNKAWTLANWIIIAMGTVIGALVVAGYSSLKSDSNSNFAAMYARQGQMETKLDVVGNAVNQLKVDVMRIDTLQKVRLDRELRDENKKEGHRQ